MKDFFSEESCTEQAVDYEIFGLIDIQDSKKPSFTSTKDEFEWAATVHNKNRKLIQYTGIDYNEYFKDLFKSDKKCDGMLCYKDEPHKAVIFVELKSGLNTTKWIYKAKQQLISTVEKFRMCHEISDFGERKVFAANSSDYNTPTVRQNDIEDFFELGFDFYVKPTIEM